MLRRVIVSAMLGLLVSCQPAKEESTRQSHADDTATQAASSENAKSQTSTPAPSTPIHLPSSDKAKSTGYVMKGVRPNEVCMQKGFAWLFQGYLQPECGTCHYKDNRYGVTPFGQLEDEAASFAVLKTTTDTSKLLQAVLGNVFCKTCVIAKSDPLYVDLEYFVQHMDRCEVP